MLTLSERWFTTQTSAFAARRDRDRLEADRHRADVREAAAASTAKISSRLSGVLTAKSRSPSGDSASGRTWPLSNATKSARAGAAAQSATKTPRQARFLMSPPSVRRHYAMTFGGTALDCARRGTCMTIRPLAVSAACLSLALALAACAGPQRPAIAVYSKRAFRGEAATLREPYPDLGEELPEFDREISSFEIVRGTWQVCRKTRFRNCRRADRSMDDLGVWDLDNAIRSLRPVED